MSPGTRVRIISASVAASMVLGLIFYAGIKGIAILTTFISFVCLIEFANMAFSEKAFRYIRPVFIFFGLLLFALVMLAPQYNLLSFVIITLMLMVAFLFKARDESVSLQELMTKTGLSIWGVMYAGVCPAFIYLIVIREPTMMWFYFAAIATFSGDIAAYFVGRKLGRNKLFPRVSPNKSVEGAIGGVFASILFGALFAHYYLPAVNIASVVGICIVASIFAQTGDFCESLLKRAANVKDSGSIMPGHGGVLDRIDGVLFSAPVIYAFSHFT